MSMAWAYVRACSAEVHSLVAPVVLASSSRRTLRWPNATYNKQTPPLFSGY